MDLILTWSLKYQKKIAESWVISEVGNNYFAKNWLLSGVRIFVISEKKRENVAFSKILGKIRWLFLYRNDLEIRFDHLKVLAFSHLVQTWSMFHFSMVMSDSTICRCGFFKITDQQNTRIRPGAYLIRNLITPALFRTRHEQTMIDIFHILTNSAPLSMWQGDGLKFKRGEAMLRLTIFAVLGHELKSWCN